MILTRLKCQHVYANHSRPGQKTGPIVVLPSNKQGPAPIAGPARLSPPDDGPLLAPLIENRFRNLAAPADQVVSDAAEHPATGTEDASNSPEMADSTWHIAWRERV